MKYRRVNIYNAKAQLSRLVAEIEKDGLSVIICRNGKPIADLVPHREAIDPLQQDAELTGAIYYVDPCSPTTEEDWPESSR